MVRTLVRGVGGVGVVLGVAGVALATSVERFTLQEMTQRAEVIVHGRVAKIECRVDPKGNIVTDVKVEVSDLVKAPSGTDKAKPFEFTIYGGVVGNRGSAICGAPVFIAGEEFVAFLSKQNDAKLRTCIGLSQGKYTVRLESGRKLAYRNLEGLRLVDRSSGQGQEAAGPEQGVQLDELLKTIKSHL